MNFYTVQAEGFETIIQEYASTPHRDILYIARSRMRKQGLDPAKNKPKIVRINHEEGSPAYPTW